MLHKENTLFWHYSGSGHEIYIVLQLCDGSKEFNSFVAFDQFNASLLNKSIHLFQKTYGAQMFYVVYVSLNYLIYKTLK